MMSAENHVDAEKAVNLTEYESFLGMPNQRTDDSVILLNNLSTVLKSKRYVCIATI